MSRPVVVALLLALELGAGLASAGEQTRVDLYDTQGRRTGYAVVDQQTGRVDYYDAQSRRTGYGRVDATGRAERFRLDGKRQGETARSPWSRHRRLGDGDLRHHGFATSGSVRRVKEERLIGVGRRAEAGGHRRIRASASASVSGSRSIQSRAIVE